MTPLISTLFAREAVASREGGMIDCADAHTGNSEGTNR